MASPPTDGATYSARVCVDVATVWSEPESPRSVDAPAVADTPDPARWSHVLDAGLRLGLHGRTQTQLRRGEPVDVVDQGVPGWVRITAPWQPSPKDPRGYPGWVRRSHLTTDAARGYAPLSPSALEVEPEEVVECARQFLGVEYLWGGVSEHGLDCSGLVHLAYRLSGRVVPRDADAQHGATRPVTLGTELPGDLYFFTGDDGLVVHVGFVTGPLRMLHASESTGLVEETTLNGERRATLFAAGRLLAAGESS